MAANFDLKSLYTAKKAEDGIEIELKHPTTSEGLGWFVTVYGEDSKRYKRVLDRISRRRQKALRQGGNKTLSVEEMNNSATEIAVACSDHLKITENGKLIEDNEVERVRIYKDFPWIRQQVIDAIEDRENFFTN